MLKNILFILAVCFSLNKLFSQPNIVPNGSFKYGEECQCVTMELDQNNGFGLYNWAASGPYANDGKMPTADWIKLPFCFKNSDFISGMISGRKENLPKTLFSNEIIGVLAEKNNWIEGIIVQMNKNLIPGGKYLLKMKVALGLNSFSKISKTYKIGIHFSKWNLNWYANPNTTQNINWEYAMNIQFEGAKKYSSNEFIPLEIYFSVPEKVEGGSSSELKNLIIRNNPDNYDDNGIGTYAFIDDVELYEVTDMYCNNNWVIENRLYEYHELPIEAGNTITAGKNVLDNNDDGPVICDAKQDSLFGDSRVTYKAGKRVVLKNGFKVEKEAYFHAYLAPCGRECFEPIADIGALNELNICDNSEHCFTLGSKDIYGMKYEWTSTDATIDNLLKAIKTNSMIDLCIPPSISNGRYLITLKVKNKCDELAVKDIILYINRSPFSGDPFLVQWGVTQHWGAIILMD